MWISFFCPLRHYTSKARILSVCRCRRPLLFIDLCFFLFFCAFLQNSIFSMSEHSYEFILESVSLNSANCSLVNSKVNRPILAYLADGNYRTPINKLNLLQITQIVFVMRNNVRSKNNIVRYLLLFNGFKKLNRVDFLK